MADTKKKNPEERLMSLLRRHGLTAAQVQNLLTDPDRLEWWIDYLDAYQDPSSRLICGLFAPPQDQIQQVKAWNAALDWKIDDAAFANAEATVPIWPRMPLVAVTLVPYLGEKDGLGGVQRTFQELLRCALGFTSESGDRGRELMETMNKWNKNIRLAEGIEHRPGLCWEVLSFARRRVPQKIPQDTQGPPHAGVVASAALHPQWIRRMNGLNIPYVRFPGYRLDEATPGLQGDKRGIWLIIGSGHRWIDPVLLPKA